MDELLSLQVSPVQSAPVHSHFRAAGIRDGSDEQNQLPEDLARHYFKIARLHTDAVLKQKNLMEIVMWVAVVFVSQPDVNVSLGEDGLDLVLVSSNFLVNLD